MLPDTPTRRLPNLTSARGLTTLAVTAAVTIALVAFATALRRLQENATLAHHDELLLDEAEAIGVALTSGREIPIFFSNERVMIAHSPTGELLADEGSASDRSRLHEFLDDDATLAGTGSTHSFGGAPHRVIAASVTTADGPLVVVVAESHTELELSLGNIDLRVRTFIPVTIAIVAGLVWTLTGIALHPADRMRHDLAGIDIRTLDRRVHVPRGDDELTRLAITMNAVLEQLDSAVQRRQRFVADASHELRTPLARMRSEVEADLLDPESLDLTHTLESQLDEIDHLQTTTDDILLLSHTVEAGSAFRHHPVDLDDLVIEEVRSAAATTSTTIDLSAVSAAQVSGTAGELRRLIRNLLDNGVRHASSKVAMSLSETDDMAVLIVDDDGPGIPEDRRREIFEPFRRLDSAGIDHGSGLGLAIVAEVVNRHDGTVNVDTSPLGGARFVVTLPLHH